MLDSEKSILMDIIHVMYAIIYLISCNLSLIDFLCIKIINAFWPESIYFTIHTENVSIFAVILSNLPTEPFTVYLLFLPLYTLR